MLNEEIADMLQDYRRAKGEAKDLRHNMIKFAVEECGLDQSEATSMDIVAFLDGYLVGRGMNVARRKTA